MKVYVVMEVWYSNKQLVACYGQKENAQTFVNSQTNSHNFSIIEMEVK